MARRAVLTIAVLLALVPLLWSGRAEAGEDHIYTARLTGDFLLPANGMRQVLALPLAAGTYEVHAQLLIGAAGSGTTCTAAITAEGNEPAYGQVSTQEAGELAPLTVGSVIYASGASTLMRLQAICTGYSKAKAAPNTFYPEGGFSETGLTSWMTATLVR
jgi:hypothetical protein